jgi:hypothetical protein
MAIILNRHYLAAKDPWISVTEILHSAKNAPFTMTDHERSI